MPSKGKLISGQEAAPYEMPVITDDGRVGRGTDHTEREAYERGFKAGEQAGFEMGAQKAAVVLEKINSLLNEIMLLRRNLAQTVESQCVELAVGMARKIVTKEIAANPKELVNMAREGLSRIERSGKVAIRIHPSLKELFERFKPELLSVHPDIMFDLDPSVPQFGAVVVGPAEEVVATVDEQLKNLIRDMVDKNGTH